MNILITGANGFVGKALGKRMVSNGWHVRGTVRSAEQADSLPAGVEVIQIKSIDGDTDWSDALAGVDTVVHLAARVHVMRETDADPLAAFRYVNVAGTKRLAQMAAINGVVCSWFFDGNIERRITEPDFFINLSSNKFKSLTRDTRREIKWKLSFLMRYCMLLTCLRMK